MTSQSNAILISVPIALLAYYCWLAKRKRSLGKTGLPGVGISEILAIIDKHRRQAEVAEPRVTWTVQHSARLRLRRILTILSETDEPSRLKMNDEANLDPAVVAEAEIQPQQKSNMEGVHDDGIHESDAASPPPESPGCSDPCPSGFSDNSSEVSSDSGRGAGEETNLTSLNSESPDGAEVVAMEPITLYEFELSQPLVGLLIGKFGCNVNEVRDKCGAHVLVRKHPCNYRMKLITVEGTAQQIEEALVMIRRKFPPKRFPDVTLAPVNYLTSVCMGMPQSVIVPATFQLHLPASVKFDAYVSAVVSGGQLFVQQPTHPTYSSLKMMDQCMNDCYADANCPVLPRPLDYGMVCAAPSHGGWYRAQVVSPENESQQVVVKFLDYGGYAELPASCLRQIRLDFMSLPFQAGECYLANIIPVDNEETGEGSEEWKAEAAYELETLCTGVVLQAEAVGSTVEGVSVVNLYRVMEDGSLLSINKELVNRGFAKWLETPQEGYSFATQEASDSQVSHEEGAVKEEDESAIAKPKKHKSKGKKKKDRRESREVDEAASMLNDLEVK